MRKFIIGFIVLNSLCSLLSRAEVRVKDIAAIHGIEEMQLVGYGLVVGLNGTGDKQRTVFTVQSITKMLQQMGVAVDADKARVKNVAAVMVTGKLRPFMKKGNKLDVQVSSLGDATSLEGGILIMTPLRGPDNVIYAVAQGPLSIGGLNMGSARSDRQNYDMVGTIPNGANLEQELEYSLSQGALNENHLSISLNNPDFTTIIRLAQAIDEKFGNSISIPQDAGLVVVSIPAEYNSTQGIVKMISEIENLTVIPDDRARIVINERTGTIVAGQNVGISKVSLAHNSISLQIGDGEGQGSSGAARSIVLDEKVNVEELAKALNAIGASPRDMVAIFQALKQAGALFADIEVL